MIRMLFLIRAFTMGGIQRQLIDLAKALDKKRFSLTVATFYGGGPLWDAMKAIPGVQVISLEKQGRWDLCNFFGRALRLGRELNPEVIFSCAQEPNLVALLLGKLLGVRVVWGIFRSTKELPRNDWLAMMNFWLEKYFSRIAERVVYNSHCGRDLYISRGFCQRNAVVILNGFDSEHFRPDMQARRRQRQAWGIGDREMVVGIVGRLHPVKDHPLFLRTAAEVAKTCPSVRFVVVGSGSEPYSSRLKQESERLGLTSRVLWAGECSNMPEVYNAMDILTLCSKEEGCPNVVGEAMACGVPCVVTDAGDSANLVGNASQVIPPGDHQAMADAIKSLLLLNREDRLALGQSGRQRIITEFSLSHMVRRTENILTGAW